FRFPSVTAFTHHVLEKLLQLGLDHVEIHEAIYDDNSLNRLQLRGFAIAERLEILRDMPVGIIALSREDLRRFNYKKGDTEGLVNVILSIKGIQIALFAIEKEDGVKLSFRSKGNYFVNDFSS
ncbi:MAG: DHH family phosphoesterase, partial [Crocinitomicaceae bacterium]